MNEINTDANDDSLGILNLLVLIAESWKFILPGTMVAAIAAAYFLSSRAPVYESTAYLPVPLQVRAILKSQALLDPVVQANGLATNFNGSTDAARQNLADNIRIEEQGKDSGIYSVSISENTALLAQAVLMSIVEQIVQHSVPRSTDRILLGKRIEDLESQIAVLQRFAERFVSSITGAALDEGSARALDIVVYEIGKKQDEMQRAKRSLDGVKMEDVVQRPTLPTAPIRKPRLAPFVAIVGAAFAGLVMIAWLRDIASRANENPVLAGKIARIRRAFELRRRSRAVAV
jgi:hypothetical protein